MKIKITVLLAIAAAFFAGSQMRAADAAAAPRVVQIHAGAGNTMTFDVKSITAAPGEALKVVLTNAGTLPKTVMGHNWILLGATADVDAFLTAAAQSPTTDYVPAGNPPLSLAATKLLGPGESDTVTFTAPASAGRFPFLCSYPGHAQVGMRGVLIVD